MSIILHLTIHRISREKERAKLNLFLYFSSAQIKFSQWFYDYRAKTVSENILIFIESKDTA